MSTLSAEQLSAAQMEKPKAGIGAFIALFLAICFFSGVFYKSEYAWLGAFDYSTLAGKFGSIDGTTFVGRAVLVRVRASCSVSAWFRASCWPWA